jgi:uncharacterized protein (TIGR02646 family)
MKLIVKNKTSKGFHRLQELKRKSGTYENVKNDVSKNDFIRDEVLTSLLEEQGYICAYCMQKINETNSSIEHIIGQKYVEDEVELGKENQINYDNLLAVCEGKSCHKEEHCDTNRSKFQNKYPQRKLFITPLENRIMQNIKFTSKGMIFYDSFTEIKEVEKLSDYENLSETENIKYDIQKVLNLNCDNLKQKRINLINALKIFTKNWSDKERIRKKLNEHISNPSNEFSQVAIYHLAKKL